jgi:transcriptional repressor NrdR
VQLRELVVIKSSGRRELFDREKLMRSVLISLRKRNVDQERVDQMVTGVIRRLEASGETEIDSKAIGELVMEGLAGLDDVAYVRYASVYKNFREARDFGDFVGELEDQEGAGGA